MSSLMGFFNKKNLDHVDPEEPVAFCRQMEDKSDLDLVPFQHKEEIPGDGTSAQPFYDLVKDFEIMHNYHSKMDEQWKYFVLVYTLLHDGMLDLEGLNDFDKKCKDYKNMEDIAKDVGCPVNELSFTRIDRTAKKMIGEFLSEKRYENYQRYFVFYNQKVEEAMRYSFTKRNERESIKTVPMQFMYDYMRTMWTPRNQLMKYEEECRMFLHPLEFKSLYARFVVELEKGNVREVTVQPALQDWKLVYNLIIYLREKNKLKEFFSAVDNASKSDGPDSVIYCAVSQPKPCVDLVRVMVEMEDYDKVVGNSKWAAEQKTKTLEVVCKMGILPIYEFLVLVSPPMNQRCLFRAAYGGSAGIMTDMLSRQEWTEKQKTTALKIACLRGYHDVYCALKDSLTNLSAEVLYEAAAGGSLDIVIDVLRTDDDINVVCSGGQTALHAATEMGHGHIAEYLLRQNADADAADSTGRTPLHLAAEKGQTDVAEILISYEADVNVQDRSGLTPLHLTCRHSNVGTMKMLLEAGSSLNIKDNNGHTVLHETALRGNFVAFKILADLGMDVTIRDSNDNSTFHMASLNGHCDILWDIKQRVPTMLSDSNGAGWWAIHFASYSGHSAAVKLLAMWGADPGQETNDNLYPLLVAKMGRKAKEKGQNILFGCTVQFAGDAEFHATMRYFS